MPKIPIISGIVEYAILESRIKKFTTMFELMIVFVRLVVGFVAIALVSAMYGVLNGARGDI
ncbi:MAG: hypothetical protein AAGF73_16620 [Actinomycetota bacterium]